jgi:cytochrome P450
MCLVEESYERPEDFIPERWYSQPELIKDKSGFSPFSMGTFLFHFKPYRLRPLIAGHLGRYNCVGKNLSLMQLRGVIALLVTRYDICFAPGEDGVAVCRDMKDQFNQHPGRLEISFRPRAG